MNKKKYDKKNDFQKNMIARQSEQIESLRLEIDKLKLECKEKDDIINSVKPLREELNNNIAEVKKYKKEYIELIKELRKMKDIINQTVYNNKWSLVKFFIK